MNKKLTFLLFSLLLAVGWTGDASAQALPRQKAPTNATSVNNMSSMKERIGHPGGMREASDEMMNQGQLLRAPQRSQNFISVTPSTIHPKSWYQALPAVTWDGGSQNITEPFTDANSMIALLKRVYTDQTIPGLKYSETRQNDVPYQTIEYGWNINGTRYYDDITIQAHPYVAIYAVEFYDANGTRLGGWDAYNNGSSFPSSWTTTGGVGTYYGAPYLQAVGNTMGTLTIPSSYVRNLNNNTGYLDIKVSAFNRYSSASVSNAPLYIGSPTYPGLYTHYNPEYSDDYVYVHHHYLPGTITPPDDAGYTVMLVKLQDDIENVPEYTYTTDSLRDYFTNYVKEIDLLTDGMRVNDDTPGDPNAGTIFAYTGDLNKFYFISKGKIAYGKSLKYFPFDRAPFYSMYEEFSPYVAGGHEDHSDFYEKLKQQVTYPVVHDCEGVIYLNHYFSMSGDEGTSENRVNSLVIYIPDNRGDNSQWQTYDTDHQPTVGMYTIDLVAAIEPSQNQDDYYTVTVNWSDNLDVITHSDGIPQTYTLYQTMINPETGELETEVVYVGPLTTYTHDFPVGDPTAYDIEYYVVGTPTAATNQDTFYAQSTPDDVTVPGTRDFLSLQWERYESDYITDNGTDIHEVNYYRNWLTPRPHAVQEEGIGITAGNVGTTGRTLTLIRDDNHGTAIPVMTLELIMNGNKAYYRIKYINRDENQQVEPGYDPNTGEMNTTNP